MLKSRKAFSSVLMVIPLVMSSVAFAQTVNRSDFEQVLVPISYTSPTAGAFGSVWDTELWVRNASSSAVIFSQGRPICKVMCGGDFPTLQPLATTRIRHHGTDGVQPGIFLYVEKARAADVTFSLHAQNVSRAATDWGTELPVVREGAFHISAFEILNVPNASEYRVALRVYGLTLSTMHRDVRVIVTPIDSEEVVYESVLRFAGVMISSDPEFPSHPTYAVIPDLTQLVTSSAERLRVRIEPLVEGKYWAFVSVTHNTSQHVTVVSPQ